MTEPGPIVSKLNKSTHPCFLTPNSAVGRDYQVAK